MAKGDNVQRLLEAEESRNKTISEAKARKAQKVRQAKADAERDVAAFRKEKDGEFEQFRAIQLGGAETENASLVRETDQQIADMKKLANQRLEKVASMIAGYILTTEVSA